MLTKMVEHGVDAFGVRNVRRVDSQRAGVGGSSVEPVRGVLLSAGTPLSEDRGAGRVDVLAASPANIHGHLRGRRATIQSGLTVAGLVGCSSLGFPAAGREETTAPFAWGAHTQDRSTGNRGSGVFWNTEAGDGHERALAEEKPAVGNHSPVSARSVLR